MLTATVVREAIYGALTSSRDLSAVVGNRVYHAVAPENASYPLVIFNRQAGTPQDAFGERAFLWQRWMVKCIDAQTSSSLAEAAQAAAIEAMTAGFTVTGGTVQDVRYLADVDYLETANGVQYRHHGALFTVALSEA